MISHPRPLFSFALLTLLCSAPALAQKPELIVQTGHADGVLSAAFSPDGRIVASTDGSVIKLWDAAAGRVLLTLKDKIYSLAFSPDGRILAGGSVGSIIRLWDTSDGKEIRTINIHAGERYSGPTLTVPVAFSHDGKWLAGASGNQLIRIWDVATGAAVFKLKGHSNRITALAFSPDDRKLASAGWRESEGGEIKLWDIRSGAELFSRATAKGPAVSLKSYQASLSLAWSPGGQMLACGSADQTVTLLDTATGQVLRVLKGHSEGVTSVAFSPGGGVLASGSDDHTVRLWSVATGATLHTLTGHTAWVSSVAFSPDGKTLASSSHDRTVRLWAVDSGAELRTLPGHDWWVNSVAFSPDGRVLASGSNGGPVGLWNVAAGGELSTAAGDSTRVESVAFSPDGSTLAGARGYYIDGVPHGEIRLWDAAGTELRTLVKEPVIFRSIAFSPRGDTLVSVSYDNDYHDVAKVWDVRTGREIRAIKDADYAAFSPDGRFLGLLLRDPERNKWQRRPCILDLTTGLGPRPLSADYDYDSYMVFSPDGRTVASGKFDNRRIDLMDIATGAKTGQIDLSGDNLGTVALSPDGRVLASAIRDGAIKLWNVRTGQELRTLTGHADNVHALAFSPDGRVLASGSIDSRIKLWDVAGGKELATLFALEQNNWMVITPDGLFDGTPSAWGRISWRFSPRLFDVAPVEAFFNEYYYPGLLSEIIAGKRPRVSQDISRKDRRQSQVRILPAATPASFSTTLTSRDLRVRVEVTEAPPDKDHAAAGGARDVRLFRNGSLVKVWRGDILKGQKTVTLEATIPIVSGENRLTAYAFNHDNIKSTDSQIVIRGDQSLKRAGTAYILAIGINEYANPQYNLRYAVADAQAFALEMRRRQNELGQFRAVVVVPLLNQAATKAGIEQALAKLSAQAQPEDLVVVYFAGHGTARQNRFYLIPHDLGYAGSREKLDEAGLRTILNKSISDRQLEQSFESLDAGHLLLVIDACNSGQALEAEEKRRGPMNSRGLAQLAYEKGMYILTAAQSYQAAVEAARLGHGYLTYALVEEGLKTRAADAAPKDGQVVIREWLDYATRRVPEMQIEKMRQMRVLKQTIAFVEGEEKISEVEKRSLQRPRVFYRREAEAKPLVMARPQAR